MYDDRTNLTKQVTHTLREYFKDRLYKTVIPRSVRLSEAPSHGLPIALYRPDSKGADAYRDLAAEFLRRERREMGEHAGTVQPTTLTGTPTDRSPATLAGPASDARELQIHSWSPSLPLVVGAQAVDR